MFPSCFQHRMFFLELNAKHIHAPKNAYNYAECQKVKSVYVFIKHIHNTYTGRHAFEFYEIGNKMLISGKISKKRVCVVYDSCMCSINIYTPLNYLINKLLYSHFLPPCMCLAFNSKKTCTCNLYITI